jgi:hypothetical protein
MITVEIKDPEQVAKGASEVEIYCDREGLNELIRKLEALANGETHVHLMSPSWAGHELSEEVVGSKNALIHHLRIACNQK